MMKKLQKINVHKKFTYIQSPWKPVILGELNNQYVKIVKVKGKFPWHFHEIEDELFFVIEGEIMIETKENKFHLKKDEFIIIPKGVEHRPTAEKEAYVMLFEPITTLNTGNVFNGFTHSNLKPI